MRKICVVTCYKDPDYVRARTLRAALQQDPENRVFIIKNSQRGALRYPEVLLKLVMTRIGRRPDVYVLTFRGYEFLPFFNLVTIGKKRVFDEFINLIEWTVYEHQKLKVGTLPARILYTLYRSWLKRSTVILTDTQAHADYSAELMKLSLKKFVAIPVSTDEEVFKPQKNVTKHDSFQVFYYSNVLPLHGLTYVIEAAVLLHDHADIRFLLVGGDEKVVAAIEKARKQGAHIDYKNWIVFDKLPAAAASAGLCVSGPFGGTLQSSMVTTGKTYQFLSMGLPTLVGETQETTKLQDGKSCLMVPQADAQAIADKILWAKNHEAKLQKIGAEGRKVYRSHYSNKQVAKMLQDVMRSL